MDSLPCYDSHWGVRAMSLSEYISPLLGRLAIAWFFLSEAYTRARDWDATVTLMSMSHVPQAPLLLVLALVVMILGGLHAGARLGRHRHPDEHEPRTPGAPTAGARACGNDPGWLVAPPRLSHAPWCLAALCFHRDRDSVDACLLDDRRSGGARRRIRHLCPQYRHRRRIAAAGGDGLRRLRAGQSRQQAPLATSHHRLHHRRPRPRIRPRRCPN